MDSVEVLTLVTYGLGIVIGFALGYFCAVAREIKRLHDRIAALLKRRDKSC